MSFNVMAAEIRELRIGAHADKTRFVLETTQATEFKVFTLTDPDRVVLDIEKQEWKVASAPESGGLIRGYRFGARDGKTLRIVLETQRPVIASAAFIPSKDGHATRLVMDLYPVEPALENAAIPAAAETKQTEPKKPAVEEKPIVIAGIPLPPKLPAFRLAPRPTIVIDPGHGGIDPGAIGRGRVFEKYVTIKAAKALQRELERTGRYKVHLTRTGDHFIKLRERVAKARAKGANLFISLHADSIGRSDVTGLSVYTLSDVASDREAAMLADKENRVDRVLGVNLASEDDDVVSILIDLAQRNTMNHSRKFARFLIEEMRGKINLLSGPERSAGFAVLTAPDVPSVLVEMGYLSSPKEAAKLSRQSFYTDLARNISAAVDRFFQTS